MTAVFDANVAVKWFVADPLSERCLEARTLHRPAMAPDLLPVEVANAFRRYVVAGDMSGDQSRENLRSIGRLISMMDHTPHLEEALSMACERNHSVHDCLYVVLALRRGVPLITADAKLVRKFVDMKGLNLLPILS